MARQPVARCGLTSVPAPAGYPDTAFVHPQPGLTSPGDCAREPAFQKYFLLLMQINDIRLVMGDDHRALCETE
jgi:hypothetical protein